MKIGIVGHAEDKFTSRTRTEAQRVIEKLLAPKGAVLVSGRCPLGGIDIWAEEIAKTLGRPVIVFPPKSRDWATGYRPRNIQIAETSDIVYCIVVRDYPEHYAGRRFPDCYHCVGRNRRHVKSGGCWTAWRAQKAEWIVIS